MFSRLARYALALAALGVFSAVMSIPTPEPELPVLGAQSRSIQARSVPSAPRFVVYSDRFLSGEMGPPATSSVLGWNVFAMSFLLADGSADQAQEWQELTAAQRSTIKSQYNAAGISLIVSAFGSTETPASSGFDPVDTANSVATWVKTYDVDGVDIDFEDFNAFNGGTGLAENWLISFTTTLRQQLPAGQYIITHAPVAPWFSPTLWGGGGYLKVDKEVGSLIDWYNVQFYNQGVTEYTTCAGLLDTSSSTWPQSAVFQIAANGVNLNKLVIGKPANTGDANNGFIDTSTLATCMETAHAAGWNAGVMSWEYPDASSAWIAAVRSLVWPVPNVPVPVPSSTSTAPGGTPTAGSCAGVAAWNSQTAYPGGTEVTFNGELWKANYWSEADQPGGASGDWALVGSCSSNGPISPALISSSAAASATAPIVTGPATPPFPFLNDPVAAVPLSRAAVSSASGSLPTASA